jgi:hypothetical protein
VSFRRRESGERTSDLASGNDPLTHQCPQHYEDDDEIPRVLGMTPVAWPLWCRAAGDEVPDRCKREGEVDEGDKGDELLWGRVEPTSGCQTLRNRRGGRALRVLKPLRCRGCGSPGVRRGGGSRLMQRELDGNGMGGGLRPDSVIQVCERQLGRWAPARSLPGSGVRATPPRVSARHPPPVAPTPPWCPADTPRRNYSVRTHKEGGCTRTHERTFVVLRHRGRPHQPAGVGRRARRAGPAERRAGSI